MRNSLPLEGPLMRPAYKASKTGDWAEFLRCDRLSAWSSVKLRECYCAVEQADEERKSMLQLIFQKSTGLSEADHRACRGEWRGHTVVCVPSLSSSPA